MYTIICNRQLFEITEMVRNYTKKNIIIIVKKYKNSNCEFFFHTRLSQSSFVIINSILILLLSGIYQISYNNSHYKIIHIAENNLI